MAKADVEGKYDIISDAKMSNAERLGDWKEYIKLGTERLKKGGVSDMLLYNWGLRVERQCKDADLRFQAAKWLDNAAAASAEQEVSNQGNDSSIPMMMSWGKYFKEVSAQLKQPWQEKK